MHTLLSNPARCSALIVLATCLAPARADDAALIADIDKAFVAPRETLKPPLLIFPLAGADGRVVPDGGSYSYMATFAAVYTDRKLIDISVPLTRDVLRDVGCRKPGAALDKESIRLCLAALGAELYAVPRLVTKGDADVLTVECHGDGATYRDRTFSHTIQPHERRRVPGLIAQSVLEFLGVKLSPKERELVVAPQVKDDRDLQPLFAVESERLTAGVGGNLLAFLDGNPRCVLGWELALTHHDSRVEALRRFDAVQPPLECPRLSVAAAVQVRELGDPEGALRRLLPHAAAHCGDTYFQLTLMGCAMPLKNERIARHVLELWRKYEPGYAGCVARARRLTAWAWDARGSDWANKVAPEAWKLFHERLVEAGNELTKALKINLSGWEAHARTINVCKGLSLPREIMEEHFRGAVKALPRYAYAYETKFEYLRPRWHGSAEELIEFGRECVATGFWDEGIPRLFPAALKDCSTNPGDSGTICKVLQLPEVWDGARDYYCSACKGADRLERQLALNRLVHWGVYGGHFDDVAVFCQRLRGYHVDERVWPDVGEVEFLYELVHAKTGRLTRQLFGDQRYDRALAKTGAALAEGDCEQAARTIEQVEAGAHVDAATVAAYRAAIAAGRRLDKDKRIDFQGAEGLESFLGARQSWQYSGDKFVRRLPANARARLTFPVGIKHGVISGNVDWSDGISYAQIVTHTRALRDPVILRYLPNHDVQLIRNNVRWEQAKYPAGEMAFRLVYSEEADVLQPAPGVVWATRVYDDVPSGFTIQVFTHDRPATVTLRGLRVERTD
jgi:hypothetical protein